MGAAYFIIVEGDQSRDTMLDGKALSNDSANINRLARANGLPTLDDFFSLSPVDAESAMAAVLGIDVADLAVDHAAIAREAASDKWFDPAQGTAFCERLSELIQSDPTLVRNADAVLRDLGAMATDMDALMKEGRRWRLQVDF